MYRLYRFAFTLPLYRSLSLCFSSVSPSFFLDDFLFSTILFPNFSFQSWFSLQTKDIVMKNKTHTKNNATLTTQQQSERKKNCHSNQSKSHNCMSEHEFYLHIRFFLSRSFSHFFSQHRAPKTERKKEWANERVEYLFIYFNFHCCYTVDVSGSCRTLFQDIFSYCCWCWCFFSVNVLFFV